MVLNPKSLKENWLKHSKTIVILSVLSYSLLLTSSIEAQPTMIQNDSIPTETIKYPKVKLQGQVVDEKTGEPIKNCVVKTLSKPHIQVKTNSEGIFQIEVFQDWIFDINMLQFEHTHYHTTQADMTFMLKQFIRVELKDKEDYPYW